MADGTTRDIAAESVGIAPDGSLQLNHVEMRERFDVKAGRQVQEISNPQMVCVIRRDLWLEVENLDIALEPPHLAAVN